MAEYEERGALGLEPETEEEMERLRQIEERDKPTWLTTALTRWATALGTFFGDTLTARIQEFLDWWGTDRVDAITSADAQRVRKAGNKLDLRGSLHEEIAEELDEAKQEAWPYNWAKTIAIQWTVWKASFGVWLEGIAALRARQVNADLHPSLLAVEAFVRYLFLNPEKKDEVYGYLNDLGISDEQKAILIKANQTLPSLTELIVLRNRDHINDNEFNNALIKQGFNSFDSDQLQKLRHWYPSPQDLVMLAGRDQFEDDTIRTFNLLQDYPQELTEAGAKAGFPEYWLKKFWGAHWRNPSINQAFEMIHRGVLTDTELDTFYDLDDISPFFRDKLKKIAFRVFNRVDIRRMLNTGQLNAQEVFEAYKEQGYDENKAQKLADFAVKLKEDSERDLTRSQVESLYKFRLITLRELVEYYEIIGYTANDSRWLGDLTASKEEEKRLQSYINRAEYQYKRNLIDRLDTIGLLAAEGMRGSRLNDLLDEWDNEAAIDKRLPRLDDVLGWKETGQINEAQLRNYLRRMNFSETDVAEYINAGGGRVSKTDAVRFFNRFQIEEPEFREYLNNLGYSEREITLFVIEGNSFRERNPLLEPTNGNRQ